MNVFITGISSGLGYGLAWYYLEKGHDVYGISRRAKPELENYQRFRYSAVDISDFKNTEIVIPELLKEVMNLDLVILNAGILNEIKDLKGTSLDEIRQAMDVNVWANKIIIELLFTSVLKVKQIVAISSGASVSGSRGWNAYSLSKAALNMLIDLYSREYTGCHFCALAPGLIKTGMQDYIKGLPEEMSEKFPVVAKLKNAYGTESMPSPKEAAPKIAFSIEKALQFKSGRFLDVREI